MIGHTEQVFIRRPEQHDVDELLDLRVRNRDFARAFEPMTPDSHFTLEGQREVLAKINRDSVTGERWPMQPHWPGGSVHFFIHSSLEMVPMGTVEDILASNKQSWNDVAPRFFGRTALPTYGPFAPDESQLNLLGEDISSTKVLEIGCGSGHSLQYMASRGAKELWGVDLSDTQISTATEFLAEFPEVKLFVSPMEQDCGLPESYFDIVYSIYAIGWTVDLPKTLQNMFRYVRPGGMLVFSWEHPLHNRIDYVNGDFVVKRPFHEEGLYQSDAWNDHTAIMNQRRLSTYINELIQAGFRIDRVVDDVHIPADAKRGTASTRWYSVEKAEFIPATFIIKCTKPACAAYQGTTNR